MACLRMETTRNYDILFFRSKHLEGVVDGPVCGGPGARVDVQNMAVHGAHTPVDVNEAKDIVCFLFIEYTRVGHVLDKGGEYLCCRRLVQQLHEKRGDQHLHSITFCHCIPFL